MSIQQGLFRKSWVEDQVLRTEGDKTPPLPSTASNDQTGPEGHLLDDNFEDSLSEAEEQEMGKEEGKEILDKTAFDKFQEEDKLEGPRPMVTRAGRQTRVPKWLKDFST